MRFPACEAEVYLEPKDRALQIIELLEKEHPDAKIALNFSNPLELLVATILSAQCTDERVNKVTPTLFERYKSAADYANADPAELETIIKSTGVFRNKSKSIKTCCQAIVERHGGNVPQTMEELVKLGGVGRKTANVVLGNAFHIESGVVVDTHVARLAQRLGLTREKNPTTIERDLTGLLPRDQWTMFSHWPIWHGRRRCYARNPDCPGCELLSLCPRIGVMGRAQAPRSAAAARRRRASTPVAALRFTVAISCSSVATARETARRAMAAALHSAERGGDRMADDTSVYDLGEVRFENPQGALGASRARRGPARDSAPPADDRTPLVAASLSVLVPGSGQLAFGDAGAGMVSLSLAGLAVSSAWAVATTWDRLVPTLAILEVPSWIASAALVAAFALAAGSHAGAAVHAHARTSTGRDAAAHPFVAGVASFLVPGWGQLLAGNRGRAGFFLGSFWLLGGVWLAVTPWVSTRLAETGLALPRALLDGRGPLILLTATGILWAVAVYDAAAGARK